MIGSGRHALERERAVCSRRGLKTQLVELDHHVGNRFPADGIDKPTGKTRACLSDGSRSENKASAEPERRAQKSTCTHLNTPKTESRIRGESGRATPILADVGPVTRRTMSESVDG